MPVIVKLHSPPNFYNFYCQLSYIYHSLSNMILLFRNSISFFLEFFFSGTLQLEDLSLFFFLLPGSCSYYLNRRNGRFTSPGYPNHYSNRQHCTWLIEVPYGLYIYLQFGLFRLESNWDWVQIFDGSSAYSPTIARQDGYQQPWGVCSSGRFLFVQFTTDGSVTDSGFSATYQAVPQGKKKSVSPYPSIVFFLIGINLYSFD